MPAGTLYTFLESIYSGPVGLFVLSKSHYLLVSFVGFTLKIYPGIDSLEFPPPHTGTDHPFSSLLQIFRNYSSSLTSPLQTIPRAQPECPC